MNCQRCKKQIPNGSYFCMFCGKRQVEAPPVQQHKRRRPKGSGSVYRAGNSRTNPWVAVTGEGVYLGRFPDQGAARLALDAANEARRNAANLRLTLRGVYESFRSSPRYEKLGKSGRDGLAAAWERLRPLWDRKATSVSLSEYQAIIDGAMVAKRYKELTPDEVERLTPAQKKRYFELKAQPPQPLGYDGKNRIKQLVSHLYNEMIRLEMIGKEGNLAELLVLPAQPKSHKRNFTAAEKDVLERHADDETVKIILIYLYTGMRLDELLKIERADVHLDEKVMIGGSKTDAGRDRRIPITSRCEPLIAYFYHERPGRKYLIERKGKPISEDTFRRAMFYPTLEALGIRYQNDDGKNVLTPHRTRHTMTADAIASGVDPVALSKVLGHTKFSTTADKYADDLDLSFLQNEIEKVK